MIGLWLLSGCSPLEGTEAFDVSGATATYCPPDANTAALFTVKIVSRGRGSCDAERDSWADCAVAAADACRSRDTDVNRSETVLHASVQSHLEPPEGVEEGQWWTGSVGLAHCERDGQVDMRFLRYGTSGVPGERGTIVLDPATELVTLDFLELQGTVPVEICRDEP